RMQTPSSPPDACIRSPHRRGKIADECRVFRIFLLLGKRRWPIFPFVQIVNDLSIARSKCASARRGGGQPMRRRNGYGDDCPKWQGRNLLRWIALAVLFGTIGPSSGCILTGPLQYVHNGFKVGPNYSEPPAPVASEWIGADDSRVVNRHLSDWWQ